MANGFALEFDRLLQAQSISVRDFARRSGVAWSFVHRVRKGKRIPPLDRIDAWADVFALTGRKRKRFLDLAHWSHVPVEVRPWLQARLKRPVEDIAT